MKIKKASGITEDFNPNKLLQSLIRSGADPEVADEVIQQIIPQIKPFTSTNRIYRLAYKSLGQFNHSTGLRYSLKKGLLRLGPSGYPFEKYFGELLRNYGYHADVGIIMEGKCVKHEVDVFAQSDKEILLVECKYRNRADSAPDVKIALYVHARFEDLRPVMRSRYPGKSYSGMLVTNTRFTNDAIQYSECSGLKIMSWGYPANNSVEKMIEDNKLYPVTIMSSINSSQIIRLIQHKIILMKDLAQLSMKDIRKLLSVTEKKASELKEQANELCFCNGAR